MGLYRYSLPCDLTELEEIKSLGDCIRVHRTKKNMTQEMLARQVDLHPDLIYRLEKKNEPLNIRYVLKIEEVLECSLLSYDAYYDFTRNTSENIKTIRTLLNIKPKSFAKLIGIHPHTLYNWEHGISYITRHHYNYLVTLNLVNAKKG